MKMAHHVFLSYVRENAAQVEQLASDLAARGIQVWLDRQTSRRRKVAGGDPERYSRRRSLCRVLLAGLFSP